MSRLGLTLCLTLSLTTACEGILGLRDTRATGHGPASGEGGDVGDGGEPVTSFGGSNHAGAASTFGGGRMGRGSGGATGGTGGTKGGGFVGTAGSGSTEGIESGGRGGVGAQGGSSGDAHGGAGGPSDPGHGGASTGGLGAEGGSGAEGGRGGAGGAGASGAGNGGAGAAGASGAGAAGAGAAGGTDVGGTAGVGGDGGGGVTLEGGLIVNFDETCLAIAETDGSVVTDPVAVHRACDETAPGGLWHRDEHGRFLASVENASLASTSEAGDPGEVVGVSAPLVPAAAHQQWDLTDVHLYTYYGFCIDVPDADFSNGIPVQLFSCHAGAAQDWTLTQVGQIRHGDYCLDVPSGDLADGTRLQIFKCYDTPPDNQRFVLRLGRIRPLNSGKCVGAVGGIIEYHVPLEVQTCTSTGQLANGQSFAMYGPITNRGLCLDVGTPSIAGPVALKPCADTDEQTWIWYF